MKSARSQILNHFGQDGTSFGPDPCLTKDSISLSTIPHMLTPKPVAAFTSHTFLLTPADT